jgi:hypothetical protein
MISWNLHDVQVLWCSFVSKAMSSSFSFFSTISLFTAAIHWTSTSGQRKAKCETVYALNLADHLVVRDIHKSQLSKGEGEVPWKGSACLADLRISNGNICMLHATWKFHTSVGSVSWCGLKWSPRRIKLFLCVFTTREKWTCTWMILCRLEVTHYWFNLDNFQQ